MPKVAHIDRHNDRDVLTRDTREWRCGWDFSVLVDFIVRLMETADYSIVGAFRKIVIERKTESDLFGWMTKGRKRCNALIKRMAEFEMALLVVEMPWSAVRDGTYWSGMNHNSALGSLKAFAKRGTLPLFGGDRKGAESLTEKILVMYLHEGADAVVEFLRGVAEPDHFDLWMKWRAERSEKCNR